MISGILINIVLSIFFILTALALGFVWWTFMKMTLKDFKHNGILLILPLIVTLFVLIGVFHWLGL